MNRRFFAAGVLALTCFFLAGLAETSIGQVRKGTGSFTLYHIAEVKELKSGGGGSGAEVKNLFGKTERVRLSPADMKKANIQGTAFSRGINGQIIVANIIHPGQWFDLPDGWYGKGNKMNPIIPFRTFAADQQHHPYGSRVFVPGVAGYVTPDGKKLDGYFWVADVGGGIKGAFRFDVFVGLEPAFHDIMKVAEGRWQEPVEVEAPPPAPSGLDYKTAAGRRVILEKLGYDVEGPVEKVLEKLRRVDDAGTPAEAALIDFQKQHPQIHRLEYGRGDSAVTRWFLAQAAKAIAAGEDYAAGPSER